jgi:hypothetical protein
MSSYYTNEQKKEIYENWLANGRPWFSKDPSQEPSYTEKKVILEMLKEENEKLRREIGLDRSKADNQGQTIKGK